MLKSPAGFAVVCLVLACLFGPADARGQRETTSELLDMYIRNRALALAKENVSRSGGRIPLLPISIVPGKSDSLLTWLVSLKEPEFVPPPDEEQLVVESWILVERLRRSSYEDLFASTAWAFVGSNSRDGLDTLQTRELRARMEAVFGPPTVTLAEMDSVESLPNDQIIEFEYWFVLNDSIPLMAIDVNGPWDRGLVTATDEKYRDQLRNLKDSFLWQLLESGERKPFADYYFNRQQRTWYISGFDGAMFFDKRIARPELRLGRPSMVPWIRND